MQAFISLIFFFVIGSSALSIKIVNQGNEALVETLGKYGKKLKPGLNFTMPFLDPSPSSAKQWE